MAKRRHQKSLITPQPGPIVELPNTTIVGRVKVSKPAELQGGWDDLQLFEVSQTSQEILDELRADVRPVTYTDAMKTN